MRFTGVVGLILLSLSTFASQAQASDLGSFFDTLAGDDSAVWKGQGTRDVLDRDGTMSRANFTLEMSFEKHFTWDGDRYDVRAMNRDEFGRSETNYNAFTLHNDALFSGVQFPREVRVLQSTATTLIYETQQIDWLFNRALDFHFEYRITPGHGSYADQLDALERVSENGTLLREDEFSVTRW